MVRVVGAVHHSIDDRDAVGASENSLAPGCEKSAITIVNNHRVLTPVEHKDAVLRIRRHASHISVRPTARQLLPVGDQLERQLTRSNGAAADAGHWST